MEQWLKSSVWGIIISGTLGGIFAYLIILLFKKLFRSFDRLTNSLKLFLYKKLDKYDTILKVYVKDDINNYGDRIIIIQTIHQGINILSFLIGFFSNVILTLISYSLFPENFKIKIFFIASTILFGLLFIGAFSQYIYMPVVYKKLITDLNSKTDDDKKVKGSD